MEQKKPSGGGGEKTGEHKAPTKTGEYKTPIKTGEFKTPFKPGAPAAKPLAKPTIQDPFGGADQNANPRATIDAIAAVVMPQADAKPAGPAVDPKKVLNSSTFTTGEYAAARRARMPGVWQGDSPGGGEDELMGRTFDGSEPAEEVISPDLWRAIQPPAQSREDRRSAALYALVINQFAVEHNPRYEPDAPDKLRGHIFVWDVTRAMNAEIPHMVGPRELSLSQTIDWIRYESSTRGWVKMLMPRAVEAANDGKPVLVLPKDTRTAKTLAIVRPGPSTDPSGAPRVAAACKVRGNDLGVVEALGVHAFEFYVHP